MNTVASALRGARAAGVPRLDAQWLLAELLGRTPAWLIAHDDHPLPAQVTASFEAGCRRRAAGEPLAYVLGHWHFRGLRLAVTPDVLVPRPETEVLVDWALEVLTAADPAGAAPRVVDLGTGSGAIALAVAQGCPRARVSATDRSQAALALARANATAHALSLECVAGNWWAAVPGRIFDLALSNPPYVAPGDPHLAALSHEPITALCAGDAGLADLRRIVAGAGNHLAPGGALLLEHGHDQGAAVRGLLEAAGFDAVHTRRDLAGQDRCSGGRRPG